MKALCSSYEDNLNIVDILDYWQLIAITRSAQIAAKASGSRRRQLLQGPGRAGRI
jgi:hypothetical protein